MPLRGALPVRISPLGTSAMHAVLNHRARRCGALTLGSQTKSARGVAPEPEPRMPKPAGSVPSELELGLKLHKPEATDKIPDCCQPPSAYFIRPLLCRKNGSS